MSLLRIALGQLVLITAWLAPSLPLAALQTTWDTPDASLLLDAQDGQLDQVDLLEAVFLANGIHDAALQHELRETLQTHQQRLGELLVELDTTASRVRAVHEFMHREVLTGRYEADCTQFSRALRHGDFNCVSATVLFQLLCRPWGIEAQAVATPTHVFSRVRGEAGMIDVQTTCAAWFELTETQRQQYEATQFPAGGDAAGLREIGDLELLAKIYYNRGVRHLEAQHFAEAEQEFRRSLQLDPLDDAAQENLLAALNNWALELCDQQHFADAARLLEQGLAINAQYPPLQANDLHIHQKWAQSLCREGRYREAAELLAAGARRQPQAALYQNGPAAIYRMWAEALNEDGDPAQAEQIRAEARQRFATADETP